jgi:7-carboxy-7-deazaguanine synthase
MYGKNPIRPPAKGDGSTLDVVEIFPTLQGEGPFTGQPSVFIRLGGCNLACGFCDTEFEDFQPMPLEGILAEITRLSMETGVRVRELVVITGGEPLRQEIAPLCEALLAQDFRVQIETNGTLWRALPEGVDIVCSPKMSDGKYHPLRPDLLARVSALKFIVSREGDYAVVGEVGQQGRAIPIYVQPMDEGDAAKNRANTEYAAMLAQTQGYLLSLQMHKMLGIR